LFLPEEPNISWAKKLISHEVNMIQES